MKHLTLAELAELTQSTLIGSPSHSVNSVSDLENATSTDISFFSNLRYFNSLKESLAGAIFVNNETDLPEGKNYLIHQNPSEAFQQAVNIFCEGRKKLSSFQGIHKTAVIHPSVKIGSNVTIAPNVVIDENVTIGPNSVILAGTTIGPNVEIGEDCIIHSNVTIREYCCIGNRVILQPGVVIGSCGFGYLQNKLGHHAKLEQLGWVEIGDDVEVGANTTIDRARFKKTSIGKGTKIDNLVQIAHGVQIGEHSLVIAQTGIAGSTKIGKHVILAGQVAVAGHLNVGDGVVVTAKSGISKSLPKAGKYGGLPAIPLSEYNRNAVQLRNVGIFIDKLDQLEDRLNELQNQVKECPSVRKG